MWTRITAPRKDTSARRVGILPTPAANGVDTGHDPSHSGPAVDRRHLRPENPHHAYCPVV